MKKALPIIAVLLFSAFLTRAASAELFKIDEARIHTELAGLTELENYLADNAGLTLSGLIAEDNLIAGNVNASASLLSGLSALNGPPLGIPAFAWGCCLGLPGIAVVYFVTEDRDQTRKALWGCVVGSLLGTVSYVVYYGVVLSAW